MIYLLSRRITVSKQREEEYNNKNRLWSVFSSMCCSTFRVGSCSDEKREKKTFSTFAAAVEDECEFQLFFPSCRCFSHKEHTFIPDSAAWAHSGTSSHFTIIVNIIFFPPLHTPSPAPCTKNVFSTFSDLLWSSLGRWKLSTEHFQLFIFTIQPS